MTNSVLKKIKNYIGLSLVLSFGLHSLVLALIIMGVSYVTPLKLEGLTVTTSKSIPGSSRAKKSSADIGPLPPVAKKIAPKITEDDPKPKPPKKARDGKLDPTKTKKEQDKTPSSKDIKQYRSKSDISRNIEDLQRLLNTVEQLRAEKRDKDVPKSPQKAAPNDDLAFLQETLDEVVSENIDTLGSLEESSGSGLAASDFDLLRKQFISCWNIPIGNKALNEFKIIVSLKVDSMGYVQEAKITNNDLNNPVYKSIAESVLRAIWHPLCTPLKLPLDRFQIWENMIITFDPEWVILG